MIKSDKSEYLISGFIKKTFKKTKCFDEMIKSLQILNNSNDLHSKFLWESKYERRS